MLGSGFQAAAHPHVWIAAETTVLYENGTVTGIKQRWLFDELYTASATQGLDANNDGVYDRAELKELAQVNIEGLKDFDYFTFAKLAGQDLVFSIPKDYWLELVEVSAPPGMDYGTPAPPVAPDKAPSKGAKGSKDAKGAKSGNDGALSRLQNSVSDWWASQTKPGAAAKTKVLALSFTLPLKQPVLAEAKGFEFSVQDPSYFISFDFGQKDTVRLSEGAPAGCTVAVREAADLQAFGAALSGQPGGAILGGGIGKTAAVTCP